MVLGLLLLENTVYGKSITRWASVSNQIRTTSSKSGSSSRYLARQKKDSFVRSRLEENYVSRSAYKLLQLDGALRFLKKAKNVVDLGASPGGWTQVVMEAMRAKRCNVFALDLLDLSPLVKMTNVDGNLVFVKGDFTSKAVQDELQEALTQRSESNATVDVVLSDMMANTSGNSTRDTQASLDLIEAAFHFTIRVLDANGWFIVKYFDSPEAQTFRREILQKHFKTVQAKKVAASRKESSEMYWICHRLKEVN